MIAAGLPELEELHHILEAAPGGIEVKAAGHAALGDERVPILAVTLGARAPEAPAIAFVGGVHGLERIGTQVVLSLLGSLVARLHWDELLHRQLEGLRIVFVPLVNPVGMMRRTRSNGRGIDLMRNAPIDARERVAFLVGGHRMSARLPWYRGAAGAPMEPESDALCSVVRRELFGRPLAVALDCHSGFGLRDRIWFPHARTRERFGRTAEVHALVQQYDALYPRHSYVFEPQSRQYLTHGDLWDYLYEQSLEAPGIFMPLTLEMGSWRWIRKSPRQALSRLGIFNPLPADRLQRVRRNHLLWLNFLCRAVHDYRDWLPHAEARERHERAAIARWFAPPSP
ncbi:MAG TPA: M14 family zinc carboxypeptidase [Usitatibacter sp.]|jgi:hypothetical protein|nr:M14 family zinc carboxypeptidase [Usitatibacter sp.]